MTIHGNPPNRSERWRSFGRCWDGISRFIAALVDLTANVKAALLLSQSIYWTRHGRDVARTGGWFLKTTEQWEMETGLSAKEQATAREVLRKLAILNEQRVGIPARLHFRLRVDQLGALLSDRIGKASASLDWGRWRRSRGIAGSVTRLSPHAGGHRRRRPCRPAVVTRAAPDSVADAPAVAGVDRQFRPTYGPSRSASRAANRRLRAGNWHASASGKRRWLAFPRDDSPEFRWIACSRGWRGMNPSMPIALFSPFSPECGVATINSRQKGETSMRDSHIHVLPKAPKLIRQKRHHCFDESANLHIQGSTRGLVQQPPTRETIANAGPSQRRGGDLILPESLLPEERAAALLLLKPCAQQAQALLDELSARMQAGAVHTSPLAYLRGLVRRAQAGEFVPELGQRVAAVRRRHEEELILRQQRELEQQRLAAECATPERQAKLASRRAEMRQIADAMQAGRPPEKRS
jgi:hypothetical protein